MLEMGANSAAADWAHRAWRKLPRQLYELTTILLAAAAMYRTPQVAAQQNGPPSSGNSAAILFVPSPLEPVSGFNPANGHLNGAGDGGDGALANSSSSQFSYPVGMAYDSNGNLFIADASNHTVRRIDHVTGNLSTFAGTPGVSGFSPATGSGPAMSAQLGLPAGLVVDSNNNVYVSDRTNNVIWKITPGQSISIYAGAGTGTCSGNQLDTIGDGCPAADATFDNPWALGIDTNNNLYIADSYNDLVRKISSSSGTISVFAGDIADAGSFGSCNANLYSITGPGPYLATQAHLCFPEGIAFDGSGNAYISEASRDIVRIVNSAGQISTFAGTGTRSTTGDGGPAISATLDGPAGIYVDPAGRVYISDFFGAEIRMVDSTGNINSVMGNTHGSLNNYSIGEPDTEPVLNSSTGQFSGAADGIYSILMDPYGNLLASDSSGNAITTVGTTGQYYFGNQQIYQTVTTTSLNAFSALYPPYVTISNPSGVTLNFTGSPTVTTVTPAASPAAFAITGGTCNFPGSLAPGTSCTVIVSFTPTTAAAYTGTIVLDSNSNTSPNTISLSGAGYGTCAYSATLSSPATFSSPVNVTTATETATLTNTGVCPISSNAASATIVNNSPSGSSAFTLVSNNCPATLNGGDTCNFNIDFTPAAVTSYSARMQLDIPSYGTIYSYLNGNGITAPAVSFAPPALTFPSTSDGSTAASMSTVMTNIGNAPLNNIVITLGGPDPSYFSFNGTNNCTATLAAGSSCTISVDFTPQAAVTNYSATISVADNAAGTPQTVSLTGTGTAALPPVMVQDTETIHTTDVPAINESHLVLDNETIHTTDTPSINQAKLVLDNETVHTTDTPAINEAKLILDNETVHTADAPAINESKLVLDNETVHTTDVPSINEAMLILDTETIHTTDTPVTNLSALVLDNEVIHTTDSPSAKLLTSPTATTLTSSTATPAAGNSVTFTATVSSAGGTPTGAVTFYDGTTALGVVALSNGVAAYSTSGLSDGAHSINAIYAGNASFLASTSNTVQETVTDFTLSLTSSGGSGFTWTILPGATGTYLITLTPPSGGYSGTITLSASGLPTGATATFSPNPLTLSSSPVTSTLTVTIPGATAQRQWVGPRGNRLAAFATVFLPLLGLPLLGMRRGAGLRRASRRGLSRMLMLLLLSLCVLGVSSCGGGFFAQPQESYTVTITATSGAVQHSANITLIVP